MTALWHIEHRKEILEMIGKVTVRWAALDLLLVDLVYVDIGNMAVAQDIILVSTNAGKQRLDKFDRAIGCSRFSADERRRILEITGQFASLLGTCNDIVHSPLITTYSAEGTKLRSRVSQVKRTGKTKDFSIDTVNQHIDRVGALLSSLEALRDEIAEKHLQPPEVER